MENIKTLWNFALTVMIPDLWQASGLARFESVCHEIYAIIGT